MNGMNITAFPGINIHSLGHYLMGLGLLRAVSGKWCEARGCWHDGIFHILGPSGTDVASFIAQKWEPTPYIMRWSEAQKKDTKAKDSTRIWQERSTGSALDVRIMDCTLVPMSRNQFNPLFGTGGNIGRRNLAKAWRKANELKKKPNTAGQWLQATLFGTESTGNPRLTNAGTWFVYNNKTFNSGLDWHREGTLSPWSFLLAMEGALLIRGGSGRRLGARARPYAVFPFVSQPLQPATPEEAKAKVHGEFWAPLWETPATLAEIQTLFHLGLARIGGNAASCPHEFAVAALTAGADAGVTHFARFELRQTTSQQVYEAQPREIFAVGKRYDSNEPASPSVLLSEFLGKNWFDCLPREPGSSDTQKKFRGLSGPVERAILNLAKEPDNPESWRNLLQCLAETQKRIDRNRNLRKQCKALPWLSSSWLARLFPRNPPMHVRLAIAFASLGASGNFPAICNVFGVTGKSQYFLFPENRPCQAVWHEGEPLMALLDLLQRRLVDSKEGDLSLLDASVPVAASTVGAFLNASPFLLYDVHQWIPAMSLLDWRCTRSTRAHDCDAAPPDPLLLLWSFFKPFFTPDNIAIGGINFFRSRESRRPAFARQLFNLLRNGSGKEAAALGMTGYQAQGFHPIQPVLPSKMNCGRLAAALALSIPAGQLSRLVNRWLEPVKEQQRR